MRRRRRTPLAESQRLLYCCCCCLKTIVTQPWKRTLPGSCCCCLVTLSSAMTTAMKVLRKTRRMKALVMKIPQTAKTATVSAMRIHKKMSLD